MNTFITVIVIIGVSICVNADLSDEQRQKIQADSKVCIADTGVDPELVNKGRDGNFSDDPKLKAFAGCMAKKIGFQDADGNTQVEHIRQLLATAINDAVAADKLIIDCLLLRPTPEETAFETIKCYYAKTPTPLNVF